MEPSGRKRRQPAANRPAPIGAQTSHFATHTEGVSCSIQAACALAVQPNLLSAAKTGGRDRAQAVISAYQRSIAS
jgi:hypothetical protein